MFTEWEKKWAERERLSEYLSLEIINRVLNKTEAVVYVE